MKTGHTYRILKIDSTTDKNYRHKLLSMGLLPGATFKVVGVAPLGDPLHIEVNDFSLSLRRQEISCLHVEDIDEY